MELEQQLKPPTITLVVHGLEGRPAQSPALVERDELVIGRGDDCDIVLADPSVSLRHATVRPLDGAYVLVDEGSSNGTWVQETRLEPRTPHVLKDQDLVRAGRVWLEVRTTPLHTVANFARPVSETGGVALRVKEGTDAGRMFRLETDQLCVVGRGAHCQLALRDAGVSRRHVMVTRRGAEVVLRALASKNGTWLEGEPLPLERDVPWTTGRELRVGTTVLELALMEAT
jgi:pSer/pThr/pTyr-binding forkhead associated (FHA) protein